MRNTPYQSESLYPYERKSNMKTSEYSIQDPLYQSRIIRESQSRPHYIVSSNHTYNPQVQQNAYQYPRYN